MCKDVVEIIYFWHITGSGIIDSCPQQTLPKIEFSQSWFLYFVYSLLNCAAMQFACHQKKISLWLVWLQICNIRTRLCLSWPKICYSWTRIWLFWRPKIRYFPDKHKRELQGACSIVQSHTHTKGQLSYQRRIALSMYGTCLVVLFRPTHGSICFIPRPKGCFDTRETL